MYQNPLVNIAHVARALPVGLLFTLVAAAVLEPEATAARGGRLVEGRPQVMGLGKG
jgi:hypothetical protein